ncbi:hypothetical protein MMC13_003444 [Lambiella insularis]|nr:hypothetical protein [Lambiella insularis]
MIANCTVCNAQKSKACTNCKSSYYCSVECQQTDWPIHKLLCKSFKNLPQRPRPSFKLAISFPPDDISPKLIWVDSQRIDDREGPDDPYHTFFDIPKIADHMGCDIRSLEDKSIIENTLRSFSLEHTLWLFCRDNFMNDGSKTNKSVTHVTKAATPIVVLRQPGSRIEPRVFEDITLADLRHTVDYFLYYGKDPNSFKQNVTSSSGSTVLGVKVTCRGDQRYLGLPLYVPVGVPRDHPIFHSSKPTDISKLIDFPVLVRKYPHDSAWKNNGDIHAPENQAATYLHLNADPTSD